MSIIKDEPCPKCRENGRDRTGDHLVTFEDGNKSCSRCGYFEAGDGNEATVKQEVQMGLTVQDIQALHPAAVPERKLTKETLEHFQCKVGYNEETRDIMDICYPVHKSGVITGYHVRTLPKQFWKVGDTKGAEFFGQAVATSFKRLWIFEGAEDAMSGYQVLREKYPNNPNPPSCIALSGSSQLERLNAQKGFLDKFDEVVLCLDNDKGGNEATLKIKDLYPEWKVWSVDAGMDANRLLVDGKKAELINALFSAEVEAKPEAIVNIDDIWDEATRMPEWGLSYPWPSLTKLTYGMRPGEGMYIGAGVKIGKSNALDQIIHHITQYHNQQIAVFKFEEQPSMTARKIAGKIMHKQFHIPDGDFTQDELKQGVQAVKESGVVLYNSYGYTPFDEIERSIRYLCVVKGVKFFALDPLTRLTQGNAADQNTQLEYIADRISTLAKDLGFFYMFFCHLKAPQTGKPHEEGGKVHSYQFTGSRAMMRACYYMVGLQRDKTAEDETERNTTKFVLLEDRMFGNSGSFDVFYNRQTGDYLEPKDGGFDI